MLKCQEKHTIAQSNPRQLLRSRREIHGSGVIGGVLRRACIPTPPSPPTGLIGYPGEKLIVPFPLLRPWAMELREGNRFQHA